MKLSKGIVGISILAAAAIASADGLKWHTKWATAAAESKKTGRPILADFTGSDWCGWCIRLHKEVFDMPEFAAWANKNVVLLELDYPMKKAQDAATKKQNESLAQKYKIQGYPTILFLTADGKVIGEYGYDSGGPAVWTKKASQILKAKPGRSG
jgi:thioredoxin-related protein